MVIFTKLLLFFYKYFDNYKIYKKITTGKLQREKYIFSLGKCEK